MRDRIPQPPVFESAGFGWRTVSGTDHDSVLIAEHGAVAVARLCRQRQLPTVIAATATPARAIPTSCDRLARSWSSVIASRIVLAG